MPEVVETHKRLPAHPDPEDLLRLVRRGGFVSVESLAARGESDLDHSALHKRLLDGGR